MIREINRQWSALSLSQARATFNSPLFIHRVENGIAAVSEDLSPNEYYWVNCRTLFGRITEDFEVNPTRFKRNRNRKLREKLSTKLNDTLGLPRSQPQAA